MMVRTTITLPFAVAATLLLVSCNTTADTDELTKLQTAATTFSAQAAALAQPADASADQAAALNMRFVLSPVPLSIDTGCASRLVADELAFNNSLNESSGQQDAAFAKLLKSSSACSDISPYVALQPTASPPPLVTQNRSVPTPIASVTFAPASDALSKYFTGIETLASATDVAGVEAAYGGLATTAGSLGTALKGPAYVGPAATLLGKIADTGLEAQQYEALRTIVLSMDPLLAQSAPTLIAQMRVQQGWDMLVVADEASDTAGLVTGELNEPTLVSNPAMRAQLYPSLRAPLDDANAKLATLSKSDPATAVRALVSAHHLLAEALRTNKGQFSSALIAAQSLAKAGQAVLAAAKPAPAPAAKKG